MNLARSCIIIAFCALVAAPADFTITPDVQAALERITADSLRGHVSFLASDLLEGRDTPSAGLDIAAEYIAAQLRRAGLEPAGDDGYFQTAALVLVKPNLDGFELAFETGGETIRVAKESVRTAQSSGAVDLTRAPAVRISLDDPAALEQWTPDQMRGKVVLASIPGFTSREFMEGMRRVRAQLARLNPGLVVTLRRGSSETTGLRLRDPSEAAGPPSLIVNSPELAKAVEALKPGPVEATVTVRMAPPVETPVKPRNVAAVLRGSDPALKDTYILVTAHYDHTGVAPRGEGDRIFNGANDNASGAAAVIELAAALAKLGHKPRRSIVFLTFFGEERGLFGSRYYARHPRFAIEKTVANLNLEQLGRTDETEGPQLARAAVTGFDYSDVGETLRQAGELAGVTVFRHEKNSDSYFARSDNQVFADLGIPAHTLSVAYFFSDYHRPGDHWDKLDYPNMEKVTRAIAVGLLMIADSPEPPRWNEANPKAERYVKASKARSAGRP